MSNKLFKLFCLLFTGILTFLPLKTVRADIAPPASAPGSSITPGQETRVRMLAENVLMVIKADASGNYIAEVSADFAMKNTGSNDEKMAVRFPLEDVSGAGDGWGGHPTVRNFKAQVNRQAVAVKDIKEPYHSDSPDIHWASFEAAFPQNKEVFINVSYTTSLQADGHPTLKYIIGTGSGWYQSIGTAALTVRLPYAASAANTWGYMPDNAVLIGKEIRWHWRDYEPDGNEIVQLSMVNPATWNRILELEAQTGNEPDNADAAVKLSQVYVMAASEKHGCMENETLGSLAEFAVQQTLARRPSEVKLHLQLAEVYLWMLNCQDVSSPASQVYLKNLKAEIQTVFEFDPANRRAVEINETLTKLKTSSTMPQTNKRKF